jgi:hypothetical protein
MFLQNVGKLLQDYEASHPRRKYPSSSTKRNVRHPDTGAAAAAPSANRMMKSRRTSWAGHVALMMEMRNAYRVFLGKREVKRPL